MLVVVVVVVVVVCVAVCVCVLRPNNYGDRYGWAAKSCSNVVLVIN